MEEHTLESLDKLYKKDLVQIVLTLQNKLKSSNDEVLEEIRKLNIIFQKLESDISITKNTQIPCYSKESLTLRENAGQMLSIRKENA